jgi:hypothetical protein
VAKRVSSVVLGIVAVAIVAGVVLFETNSYSELTSLIPNSHTFTISVNYTGPWKLSYQGYTTFGLGGANPTGANVTVTGSGVYSKSITLSGPHDKGLGLCADAQKLDASNATLVLAVTGPASDRNETSLPDGSVLACGNAQP